MKKVIKAAALVVIFAFVFVSCFFKGSVTALAAEDINDIGTRVISDTNKVWTISFKESVNISSLSNSVYVEDLTSGGKLPVNVSQGDENTQAKVKLTSGTYKMGHNYKLTVDKNAKSQSGKNLARVATLNFSVVDKTNNNYTATGKVEFPVSFLFKQITITSTNLPKASKYSIEGTSYKCDVGKTIPLIFPGYTAKVTFYDENDHALGETSMDVSSQKDNVTMKMTILD